MSFEFSFVTDTSTLCVYDLKSLEHRLDDDADWWVWPSSAQLEEVNSGAAAFVDLGSDGRYEGVLLEALDVDPVLSVMLNVPSGKVFIGAAEETTSDGMEPDCTRGGPLLSVSPGAYRLKVARSGLRRVHLTLEPTLDPVFNSFHTPLELPQGAA